MREIFFLYTLSAVYSTHCTRSSVCVFFLQAASEKDEVDVEAQSKRTTSDPKAEIQKLFSHLKTSRHDSKKAAKPRPWKETKGPRNPFAGTPSHPMREVVIDVLKQLDAWKVLHGFCAGLPIFKMLEEDKAFLSSSVAEGGSTPLDTLIERCLCVQLFSYNVHVHMCIPYLWPVALCE